MKTQKRVAYCAGCAAGADVSFKDWPSAAASEVLRDVLHSATMARLVSDLLSDVAAGAPSSGGESNAPPAVRLEAESLLPIMQATSLREGDHLTPHNDLLAASGSNRRIAFVLQLSDSDWDRRCGGSFVWCDPFEVLTPDFNTLILFPTTHFSVRFDLTQTAATHTCGSPVSSVANEPRREGQ